MRDKRGLDGRHGEADGHRGNAERDDEGDGMPPQQRRGGGADDRQADGRPQRRFALRREIKNNAEAVGDGKPREQPSGRNLLRRPLPDLRAVRRIRNADRDPPAGRRGGADRPRRRTGFPARFSTLSSC